MTFATSRRPPGPDLFRDRLEGSPGRVLLRPIRRAGCDGLRLTTYW